MYSTTTEGVATQQHAEKASQDKMITTYSTGTRRTQGRVNLDWHEAQTASDSLLSPQMHSPFVHVRCEVSFSLVSVS